MQVEKQSLTPSLTLQTYNLCKEYCTFGRTVSVINGEISYEPIAMTALRIASWVTIFIPIVVAITRAITKILISAEIKERKAFWEQVFFKPLNGNPGTIHTKWETARKNLIEAFSYSTVTPALLDRVYVIDCYDTTSDIPFGMDGRFRERFLQNYTPSKEKTLVLFVPVEDHPSLSRLGEKHYIEAVAKTHNLQKNYRYQGLSLEEYQQILNGTIPSLLMKTFLS